MSSNLAQITGNTKPKLVDQISKVEIILSKLTNSIKSIDDIDTFLELDTDEGITKLDMNINILESGITKLNIYEDDPSRKELYCNSLHYIDIIIRYIKDSRNAYEDYMDLALVEIDKLKIIKEINDDKIGLSTELLARLTDKRERALKKLLYDINQKRLEMLKLLVFTKEILNKIKERKNDYYSMSA